MKQKETYDRIAVGVRLRERRKQLGWDRKYVAGKIGLAEKYYSDIERGTCGMSVETLMALTDLYDLSMDALIYGKEDPEGAKMERLLIRRLGKLPTYAQDYCVQMLLLFMKGIQGGEEKNERI